MILEATLATQLEATFERDLMQYDTVAHDEWRLRLLRDRRLKQFANLCACWL